MPGFETMVNKGGEIDFAITGEIGGDDIGFSKFGMIDESVTD